ncbi:hypothetical protein MOV76_35670 [Rhizobium sp. PRIMUS64]|uniref:hypothetical protein n=1 Tax=Rhizobium sp. PRIMUS64 TaxID=2908925 RepID=UPI001FF20E82|nr:hypothetical protein [Rhizobium sp. PRIMUS64]MCJ9696904.1 hypothetical protein [Rhizobium sp. PRIMUS64]
MADPEGENSGLFETRTPPENSERAAKVGATRAAIEADMTDLAAQLATGDEPEQQSLLLDEMDEQHSLFAGPVKHVASILQDAKRARGRPKGSQNKATRTFGETLMRMGFKHPGLNLAALANADPVALAVEVACLPVVEGATAEQHIAAALQTGVLKRDDVVSLMLKAHEMIQKANAELLPYFESKKAQPIDPGEARAMGIMVIGVMPSDPTTQAKTIDLTHFDQPE